MEDNEKLHGNLKQHTLPQSFIATGYLMIKQMQHGGPEPISKKIAF